ncbi:MAG TPA: DUF4382 domain-containing protein [Dehalococcoidia bacterium]|nr:DUF4382 domain-containing protein [Dehalococcoidia bacterium]
MATEFDKILDKCIDRINGGEDIESCLADYSEHADELRLFLNAMTQTKSTYSFTPSNSAKAEARQRFNNALRERQQRREARQPFSTRFLGWSRVWATAAAVILIAIVGYFGLRPVLFPSDNTPLPSPKGNFVFLISDDANAIGDFTSLTLTISGIGLLPEGSENWIEFEPEVDTADLTLLQGEVSQQIWRGDISAGEYIKVFIYISDVTGELKDEAEAGPVEIKLPSGKLHLSVPFQVSADTVTWFTYDLTVVATGSSQNGPKYILRPVVGESGAVTEQD